MGFLKMLHRASVIPLDYQDIIKLYQVVYVSDVAFNQQCH